MPEDEQRLELLEHTTKIVGAHVANNPIAAADSQAKCTWRPASGWTGNSKIPYAKSVMDYLFRWLGAKYISPDYQQSEAGETPNLRPTEEQPQKELPFQSGAMDAPICSECGSMMTNNGSCYKCENCGATSGCS